MKPRSIAALGLLLIFGTSTWAQAPARATTMSSTRSDSLAMGGRDGSGASQAGKPPAGTTWVGAQAGATAAGRAAWATASGAATASASATASAGATGSAAAS